MIKLYKMGMSYYANKEDRNSGLFEYNMITEALTHLDDNNKDAAIVVNGIRTKKDEENIEKILKDFGKVFFVMSDDIALKTSIDIMNKCSLVLHQGCGYNFDCIKTKQMYSFIPELFYFYIRQGAYGIIPVCKMKQNLIHFGGNNTGRQDKFDLYNIGDSDRIFSRIKNNDVDFRLEHSRYLLELASYKYSLIIARDSYRQSNWLTSRFFEAIALSVLPVCDIDFDKSNAYASQSEKVSSYKELLDKVNKLESNEDERLSLLNKYRQKVEERNCFLDVIKSQL